jgi:NAD(P)-dependent dehydrogenase (short-subunit alcohol dehydrogenase family)
MATILITGSGRGLGQELARQYAADGWRVIGERGARPGIRSMSGAGGRASR